MVSIGDFRRDPGPFLDAVARGESLTLTRYRREVARLVPPRDLHPRVSGAQVMEAMRVSPLPDDSWAEDLRTMRAADDGRDPWVGA